MFDQFTQLVSDASGWAYAIIFVLAFLDAMVPLVPSESSVITAGVVASTGDLSVPLVVLAAAAGAFAGDNTTYLLRSTSFPSGHAATAAAAACALLIVAPTFAPAWIAMALVMAASRVYVGAHYPSDVLAGAGLGVLVGLAPIILIALS